MDKNKWLDLLAEDIKYSQEDPRGKRLQTEFCNITSPFRGIGLY